MWLVDSQRCFRRLKNIFPHSSVGLEHLFYKQEANSLRRFESVWGNLSINVLKNTMNKIKEVNDKLKEKDLVPKKTETASKFFNGLHTTENLSNQQYRFICEMLWGGVPADKNWAVGTKMFQESYKRILEKYPLLDKSI